MILRACLWVLCSVALLAAPAEARPFRGSTRVDVVLCQTSDAPTPTRTLDDYRRLFFQPGVNGLADYWRAVSYGIYDNAGSQVHGWYTVQFTTAQFLQQTSFVRATVCLSAAASAGVMLPSGGIRYIVTNPFIALEGGLGLATLPESLSVGDAAHEAGHTMGLTHTFSNDRSFSDTPQEPTSSQPGEYDDPFDLMSWATTNYRVPTPFGDAAPGATALHLDRMGWLPRSRIVTHAADGVGDNTYEIAALSAPEVRGALQVRVPFDPADPFRYYTIELRHPSGRDAGIPGPMLLIHEVVRRDGNGNATAQQNAFLQRELSNREVKESLSENGVEIELVALDFDGRQAIVRVQSDPSAASGVFGPNTCKPGFVWREADDYDWVCVTPAIRAQTAEENALASSRRAPGGGCMRGFVARNAFPRDSVCAPDASRTQAATDNAQAQQRYALP